jgi:hypothetical protein
MTQTARNSPCTCGSGVKYKKCCLPKAAPSPGAGHLSPGTRIPPGHRFAVGAGADGGVLDDAVERFEHRPRGQGTAQQMMDFCQPLIEATRDRESLDRAMTLGMLFWNLAVGGRQGGTEEMLAGMLKTLGLPGAAAEEFRGVAEQMIERHRRMFPRLHQ